MHNYTQRLMLVIFALALTLCPLLAWSQGQMNTTLRTAWESLFPYEYLSNKSLQASLTGLDIELAKQFADETKSHLQFNELSWDQALQHLKQGDIDMIVGVAYSKELEQDAYFSKSYRVETDALFIPRTKSKAYHFRSSDELIAYIKARNFHLGIRKNAILADAKMNAFIHDAQNSKYITLVQNDLECLELLLNHQIDGFITDRISGSTLVWQARANTKVTGRDLKMKTTIHLIFSKKTVAKQTVDAFNNAIQTIRHEAVYREDFSWYIYPVLMMQATDEHWFKLLDLLGIISFSISGVLIAYGLNKSLFSALIYAILPCLCGGILRDVIFGRTPVEALETPKYLLLICGIVFIGHFILYWFNKLMQYEIFKKKTLFMEKFFSSSQKYLEHGLIITDALGLATLAVSGVMISLMARAEPLWLWGPFFSFLTASFGTIIRDILSKNERLEDVVGELYSEVGIAWGFILSIALIMNVNNIQPNLVKGLILFTVAGGFITRLLVHYLKVPNVYFK